MCADLHKPDLGLARCTVLNDMHQGRVDMASKAEECIAFGMLQVIAALVLCYNYTREVSFQAI